MGTCSVFICLLFFTLVQQNHASSVLIRSLRPHANIKLQFGAEHSPDPNSVNAYESARIGGETKLGIEIPRGPDHRNVLIHKIGTYLTVIMKALANTVEPSDNERGSSTHLDFHVDADFEEPDDQQERMNTLNEYRTSQQEAYAPDISRRYPQSQVNGISGPSYGSGNILQSSRVNPISNILPQTDALVPPTNVVSNVAGLVNPLSGSAIGNILGTSGGLSNNPNTRRPVGDNNVPSNLIPTNQNTRSQIPNIGGGEINGLLTSAENIVDPLVGGLLPNVGNVLGQNSNGPIGGLLPGTGNLLQLDLSILGQPDYLPPPPPLLPQASPNVESSSLDTAVNNQSPTRSNSGGDPGVNNLLPTAGNLLQPVAGTLIEPVAGNLLSPVGNVVPQQNKVSGNGSPRPTANIDPQQSNIANQLPLVSNIVGANDGGLLSNVPLPLLSNTGGSANGGILGGIAPGVTNVINHLPAEDLLPGKGSLLNLDLSLLGSNDHHPQTDWNAYPTNYDPTNNGDQSSLLSNIGGGLLGGGSSPSLSNVAGSQQSLLGGGSSSLLSNVAGLEQGLLGGGQSSLLPNIGGSENGGLLGGGSSSLLSNVAGLEQGLLGGGQSSNNGGRGNGGLLGGVEGLVPEVGNVLNNLPTGDLLHNKGSLVDLDLSLLPQNGGILDLDLALLGSNDHHPPTNWNNYPTNYGQSGAFGGTDENDPSAGSRFSSEPSENRLLDSQIENSNYQAKLQTCPYSHAEESDVASFLPPGEVRHTIVHVKHPYVSRHKIEDIEVPFSREHFDKVETCPFSHDSRKEFITHENINHKPVHNFVVPKLSETPVTHFESHWASASSSSSERGTISKVESIKTTNLQPLNVITTTKHRTNEYNIYHPDSDYKFKLTHQKHNGYNKERSLDLPDDATYRNGELTSFEDEKVLEDKEPVEDETYVFYDGSETIEVTPYEERSEGKREMPLEYIPTFGDSQKMFKHRSEPLTNLKLGSANGGWDKIIESTHSTDTTLMPVWEEKVTIFTENKLPHYVQNEEKVMQNDWKLKNTQSPLYEGSENYASKDNLNSELWKKNPREYIDTVSSVTQIPLSRETLKQQESIKTHSTSQKIPGYMSETVNEDKHVSKIPIPNTYHKGNHDSIVPEVAETRHALHTRYDDKPEIYTDNPHPNFSPLHSSYMGTSTFDAITSSNKYTETLNDQAYVSPLINNGNHESLVLKSPLFDISKHWDDKVIDEHHSGLKEEALKIPYSKIESHVDSGLHFFGEISTTPAMYEIHHKEKPLLPERKENNESPQRKIHKPIQQKEIIPFQQQHPQKESTKAPMLDDTESDGYISKGLDTLTSEKINSAHSYVTNHELPRNLHKLQESDTELNVHSIEPMTILSNQKRESVTTSTHKYLIPTESESLSHSIDDQKLRSIPTYNENQPISFTDPTTERRQQTSLFPKSKEGEPNPHSSDYIQELPSSSHNNPETYLHSSLLQPTIQEVVGKQETILSNPVSEQNSYLEKDNIKIPSKLINNEQSHSYSVPQTEKRKDSGNEFLSESKKNQKVDFITQNPDLLSETYVTSPFTISTNPEEFTKIHPTQRVVKTKSQPKPTFLESIPLQNYNNPQTFLMQRDAEVPTPLPYEFAAYNSRSFLEPKSLIVSLDENEPRPPQDILVPHNPNTQGSERNTGGISSLGYNVPTSFTDPESQMLPDNKPNTYYNSKTNSPISHNVDSFLRYGIEPNTESPSKDNQYKFSLSNNFKPFADEQNRETQTTVQYILSNEKPLSQFHDESTTQKHTQQELLPDNSHRVTLSFLENKPPLSILPNKDTYKTLQFEVEEDKTFHERPMSHVQSQQFEEHPVIPLHNTAHKESKFDIPEHVSKQDTKLQTHPEKELHEVLNYNSQPQGVSPSSLYLEVKPHSHPEPREYIPPLISNSSSNKSQSSDIPDYNVKTTKLPRKDMDENWTITQHDIQQKTSQADTETLTSVHSVNAVKSLNQEIDVYNPTNINVNSDRIPQNKLMSPIYIIDPSVLLNNRAQFHKIGSDVEPTQKDINYEQIYEISSLVPTVIGDKISKDDTGVGHPHISGDDSLRPRIICLTEQRDNMELLLSLRDDINKLKQKLNCD